MVQSRVQSGLYLKPIQPAFFSVPYSDFLVCLNRSVVFGIKVGFAVEVQGLRVFARCQLLG